MTDPDTARPSVPAVEARLRELVIETPSWGYADSGTRFGVFPQAARLHVRAEPAVVVHRVPREVHRHRTRRAGEPVHLRRVVHALEDIARTARRREHAEARPRVGVAPRRRLDHELAQPGLDRLDVHPPIGELGGVAAVRVGHGVSSRGDRLMRWSGGEGR